MKNSSSICKSSEHEYVYIHTFTQGKGKIYVCMHTCACTNTHTQKKSIGALYKGSLDKVYFLMHILLYLYFYSWLFILPLVLEKKRYPFTTESKTDLFYIGPILLLELFLHLFSPCAICVITKPPLV